MTETISKLLNQIKDLEVELLTQRERADKLQLQNNEYDKLMGYKNNMSYEDKLKHNEDSEQTFKDTIETMEENSIKRQFIEETLQEERMIDLALEVNQLQFECSELFHSFKDCTSSDETYNEYKKHKRNFYAMIRFFYELYIPKEEEYSDTTDIDTTQNNTKDKVFLILISALRKQRRIYKLDEELKGLSA